MTSSELLAKHTCEIVEDLLPIYAEYKATKPSPVPQRRKDEPALGAKGFSQMPAFAFVEEHVKCCADCQSLLKMALEDFNQHTLAPPTVPPIHFRRKYYIRLAFGAACAILTATGVLVLLA